MPLYKDIMPYFDQFIHVYGLNLNILWSSLKIWTPKNLTILDTQFLNPVLDPATYLYLGDNLGGSNILHLASGQEFFFFCFL